MEQYPSIEMRVVGKPVYAFDKIDGSNIRAEWTRKNGFWKWGTKKCLLDEGNPDFGEAIHLFRSKYEDELNKRFRKERMEKVTCFFEYWSPNTFAGFHAKEPHSVTLFDLKVYKRGYMLARDFLRFTDGLDVAKFLYHGNPTEEFLQAVRNGTLSGMSFEGVVCKGEYIYPGTPLMFKVKNQAWFDNLKERCKGDEKLFEELK